MIHRTRIAVVLLVASISYGMTILAGSFPYLISYRNVYACNLISEGLSPGGIEAARELPSNIYSTVFPAGYSCVNHPMITASEMNTAYIHFVDLAATYSFLVPVLLVALCVTWIYTRFSSQPVRSLLVFFSMILAQIAGLTTFGIANALRLIDLANPDCAMWVLLPRYFGTSEIGETIVFSDGCPVESVRGDEPGDLFIISLDPTPAAIIAVVALAIAVVLAWKGTHRIVEENTHAA